MGHQASKCTECSVFFCLLLSPVFYLLSFSGTFSPLHLVLPVRDLYDLLLFGISTSLLCCCHSCWLSLEGGLLYAFVGPAAAVVLVLPLFALCISLLSPVSHQHEFRVHAPITHFLRVFF